MQYDKIKNIVEEFRNSGSVGIDNKGHSERKVTIRRPAILQLSPRKSTRRPSQEVGISRETVQ